MMVTVMSAMAVVMVTVVMSAMATVAQQPAPARAKKWRGR